MKLQQLIELFASKHAEVAYDRERDRLIVDARNSDVDDGDIAILSAMENLVDLNLAGSEVTNEAMKNIVNFSKLENLDLGRTKCDAGCLKYLPALAALQCIGLSGMMLSGEALQLTQLQALDVFYLADTGIPKHVVREIIQATNVTVIDLSGNGFQADDFLDLDLLEDDSRTVSLKLSSGNHLAIARPPVVRTELD